MKRSIHDIEYSFRKYEKTDFGQFDRISDPFDQIPDLHGLVYLSKLFNFGQDIISDKVICSDGSEYISLTVQTDDIKRLSDKDILELVRCGITFVSEYELLGIG